MKRIPRLLLTGLLSLLALAATGAALFGYFLYTPAPEVPQLSGTLSKGSIEVAGIQRSYRTYVPKDLPQGAPLVLVMHGSGEGPQAIRAGTGYGFERLADQHGFAVVYPKSFGFDWNDCSSVGDTAVNGVRADDAGFLAALVDKLVGELGVDPKRVFAAGVSNGGSMALRLALEQPQRYRAVAAALANVPAPQNFQCQPGAQTPSVMILNGTEDPLVPYAGGEINLLGLFYKGGYVISSTASARYFADRNAIAGPPQVSLTPMAQGSPVEHARWQAADGRTEVELVTLHGAGHGLPQPWARRPRLLGPSPMAPNGPALIWAFFERQAQ
ncbi:prolyl oligopeptidase family serine peptidase [Pelomonas sp. V22]|uniref:extracellular catalytic domain type 1 short-chain-length polyhydroxyalkanoate depolymerase n=1 Tax=Pelomonas sp. V22 TaxID=2822139 RepID=UPI0024A918B0|nr:PHB depolymerase family esterase [Pelomonas sp. V22]MDI4635454.1 prolyl oligopeptidase family serine peptidase [Pelomonas sp. V22]